MVDSNQPGPATQPSVSHNVHEYKPQKWITPPSNHGYQKIEWDLYEQYSTTFMLKDAEVLSTMLQDYGPDPEQKIPKMEILFREGAYRSCNCYRWLMRLEGRFCVVEVYRHGRAYTTARLYRFERGVELNQIRGRLTDHRKAYLETRANTEGRVRWKIPFSGMPHVRFQAKSFHPFDDMGLTDAVDVIWQCTMDQRAKTAMRKLEDWVDIWADSLCINGDFS